MWQRKKAYADAASRRVIEEHCWYNLGIDFLGGPLEVCHSTKYIERMVTRASQFMDYDINYDSAR